MWIKSVKSKLKMKLCWNCVETLTLLKRVWAAESSEDLFAI